MQTLLPLQLMEIFGLKYNILLAKEAKNNYDEGDIIFASHSGHQYSPLEQEQFNIVNDIEIPDISKLSVPILKVRNSKASLKFSKKIPIEEELVKKRKYKLINGKMRKKDYA